MSVQSTGLSRSERRNRTAAREASPWRAPDIFESVRVVDKATAIELAGVSARTWDRLDARGETPPKTQISERRIGYRLSDLRAWLDARRIAPAAAPAPAPADTAST
jgi:predicted DNA-binding transcriptional regulator AlpA